MEICLCSRSISSSLSINANGAGSLYIRIVTTGALSIDKTLGSAETMTIQDLSAGNTITLGGQWAHKRFNG